MLMLMLRLVLHSKAPDCVWIVYQVVYLDEPNSYLPRPKDKENITIIQILEVSSVMF
jgi:hypothetical protein